MVESRDVRELANTFPGGEECPQRRKVELDGALNRKFLVQFRVVGGEDLDPDRRPKK
jgi:hypothetical protein